MKRGGPGLLVFLIVALLVAFLLMKQMQSPTSFGDKAAEKAGDNAVQAAESAVNMLNEAMRNSSLCENADDHP